MFSRDVMSAIVASLNNEKSAMLMSNSILGELNSFVMQKRSFISWNKYAVGHEREKSL